MTSQEQPKQQVNERMSADDWTERYSLGDVNQGNRLGLLYAKFFVFLRRLPASLTTSWSKFFPYRVYCTYKGERYRVTGASRLGDIWLSKDFGSQYTDRVYVDECSNFSAAVQTLSNGGLPVFLEHIAIAQGALNRQIELLTDHRMKEAELDGAEGFSFHVKRRTLGQLDDVINVLLEAEDKINSHFKVALACVEEDLKQLKDKE